MVQNDFNKIAVKMFLIKYMLLSMYFQKMTLHLDLEMFKEPFVKVFFCLLFPCMCIYHVLHSSSPMQTGQGVL